MDGYRFIGKDWTALFCVIANREDVVEMLVGELVHMFGTMVRNVNPKLPHHRYGFGAYRPRISAGAENVMPISDFVAKQTFCHLASGRVPSTENQNSFLRRFFSGTALGLR